MKDADIQALLLEYLSGRGAAPKISYAPLLQEGVLGQRSKSTGDITIDPRVGPGVLSHELTHSAQSEMRTQAVQNPAFKKIYDQLYGARGSGEKAVETARSLAPAWTDNLVNAAYRSSPRELQAFGVGMSPQPDTRYEVRAPLHVDPTLATEFMILLDAAIRNQEK